MFTGEEILEDDEFAVTATEQQVIDCIGGYIVRRLFKQGKLSCEGCRDSLVSTNQGIFVQEKQHDGAELLSSSSASLAAFLLSAEGTFRASMSVKDFSHGDEIGKSLREQIGRKAPKHALQVKPEQHLLPQHSSPSKHWAVALATKNGFQKVINNKITLLINFYILMMNINFNVYR